MNFNIINEKFSAACIELDKLHGGDPVFETKDGIKYPRELLYIERLVECLDQISPDANEILQLAIKCQHLCRWQIPREHYPMNRPGYLMWRNGLFQHQSNIAHELLINAGYDEDFINKVLEITNKRNINSNPNVQLLEDIVCLIFIKFYLEEFSKQHETNKIISIIKKTWIKMSDEAKENALLIDLPKEVKSLIGSALQV